MLAISGELSADLTAVSTLFVFQNLTWALAALLVAPFSDRLGRKPVILVGVSLVSLSAFGTALAQDYVSMSFWRTVAGIGGGTQMPTVFALAADLVAPAQRGKALGTLMTGQSLALVVGAPLSALVGSLGTWRWAPASLGIAAFASLLMLAWLLPKESRRTPSVQSSAAGIGRLILRPRVLALLCCNAFERVCFSSVVVFFATYLILAYEVDLRMLSVALVVAALGNVLGNQLGGKLADRFQTKSTAVAIAMFCNGLMALPLLMTAPGVLFSVLFGLLYNLTNALGRPSLLWLISEISRESRGAVMGITITLSGMGWLLASGLGGLLIAQYGFGALGVLAGVSGIGSAACALLAGYLGRSRAAHNTADQDPVSREGLVHARRG